MDIRAFWRPAFAPPPPPPPEERLSLSLARLQSSLEEALAGKVKSVSAHSRGGPPRHFGPPELELAAQSGGDPLRPGEADFPVFGEFVITMEGHDGDWLFIEPHRPHRLAPFVNSWLVSFVGAAVLISLLSAWTAKWSLQPLDRLVEAAERFGRGREAEPAPTEGLREFAAIAHTLNAMQSRIKGFVDERTQMLAAVSHDLRTSLTRLRLEAEELDESRAKNQIIADVEDMERMISATLTFAADDLKGERLEIVDLAALLISLCDSFTDRGLLADYAGADHARILCQPTAMKRAFSNLIDNAIKYGERAQASLVETGGDVIVTIADQGLGIPPDKVELAFQPFRRLEGLRNQNAGGVGLGLSIARDIIKAHGGEIRLSNQAEGGLSVEVRLPGKAPSGDGREGSQLPISKSLSPRSWTERQEGAPFAACRAQMPNRGRMSVNPFADWHYVDTLRYTGTWTDQTSGRWRC
jgi:signal transduction histidine kinase